MIPVRPPARDPAAWRAEPCRPDTDPDVSRQRARQRLGCQGGRAAGRGPTPDNFPRPRRAARMAGMRFPRRYRWVLAVAGAFGLLAALLAALAYTRPERQYPREMYDRIRLGMTPAE